MVLVLSFFPVFSSARGDDNRIVQEKRDYFSTLVTAAEAVAVQEPTPLTFRVLMRPAAHSVDGFYDATLIDAGHVIRQVYDPLHFLARGYDLDRVPQLREQWRAMDVNPAPQITEPASGGFTSPRLVSVRVPLLKDGKAVLFVSIMVRAEAYEKAVGVNTEHHEQ